MRENQNCDDAVFPTAVNILDRYLSLVAVRRSQLQLLGSVCLLLTSKIRQSGRLHVDTLVYLTDDSVTHEQIKVRLVFCPLSGGLCRGPLGARA